MNTTFASSPWPVPPASRRDAGWRFGRELDPVLAPLQGWCFELRRNVSLSPRQMLLAYALLCALSLAVAAAFWSQGVSMVVLFGQIEHGELKPNDWGFLSFNTMARSFKTQGFTKTETFEGNRGQRMKKTFPGGLVVEIDVDAG